MSNVVKYPNLKPFKSGSEWNGNKVGRPKQQYKRDKYTDELFEKYKANGNIEKVSDILFEEAIIERKPWALTLICQYFLTRPKNDEGIEEIANNNDVVEKLKTIPSDKLMAIHKMLSEEIERD
jgi:hypothetical protein